MKFLGTPFLQNTSGQLLLTSRSSRLQMFFKIVFLRLFLKNLQAEGRQIYKKRFQQRCFPVKFAKILRTSFLQNASGEWFCSSGGYICTFLKKQLRSYFAALLRETNFFFSAYRLIYKKSN